MRIAIIGTEQSSCGLAPWGDASWQIWACSRAHLEAGVRIDEYFELHNFDRLAKSKPEGWVESYVPMLARMPLVWLARPFGGLLNSKIFDPNPLVKEFGPYFFTSSIAWQMAEAIRRKAEVIGLYGVDMTAGLEYQEQRPGCHYFVQKARERGIEVVAPPESDILQPPALYGFREFNAHYRKMLVRQARIERELQGVVEQRAALDARSEGLGAALQEVRYARHVWGGLE